MTPKTQTRRRFLAGVASMGAVASVGSGAGAIDVSSALGSSSRPLDMRYGTTASPRMSVSLPTDWFVTQNLTNVIDPVQLFAIANMPLPTQQKNVQGVANPTLIPTNATLVMVSAFSLTPDMAAWNLRSSETPSAPSLASLGPGHPYGNVGLLTRSWTVYGMQWAVEGLVWIGTAATNADIATIDAVLQSLSYDEPL